VKQHRPRPSQDPLKEKPKKGVAETNPEKKISEKTLKGFDQKG